MTKKVIYALLLMAVVVACGGGGGTPEISKDYLSVPNKHELLADGLATKITIDANCNWTITKDADWLTVNPMSGSNTQIVTISATKNNTKEDRMAILTVKGGSLVRTVTVTQFKAEETPVELSLSTNTTTLSFGKDGESKSFTITSNTSWTISCPGWCTLTTQSGNGNATITVTAQKNTKAESRSGYITIKGEGVNNVSITLSQQAADKNDDEPNPDDNLPPS